MLACLFRNGDLTVGDLAAFERVQPPSMTRTVKLLETGGYVTRRAHDTDGRQVVVSLTDHGRDLVRADRARRDAWLARAGSASSPRAEAPSCGRPPRSSTTCLGRTDHH